MRKPNRGDTEREKDGESERERDGEKERMLENTVNRH